jgi:hypothetical protein
MDNNGLLRPIHDVNLIFAGETVYHIPTYREAHLMRMGAVEITVSPLTSEQKEKVVLDTLKHDDDLQGKRLECWRMPPTSHTAPTQLWKSPKLPA